MDVLGAAGLGGERRRPVPHQTAFCSVVLVLDTFLYLSSG